MEKRSASSRGMGMKGTKEILFYLEMAGYRPDGLRIFEGRGFGTDIISLVDLFRMIRKIHPKRAVDSILAFHGRIEQAETWRPQHLEANSMRLTAAVRATVEMSITDILAGYDLTSSTCWLMGGQEVFPSNSPPFNC